MIDLIMIAPCGMNCALCLAYQRDKKRCMGCNSNDINMPKSCQNCIIKNCDKKKSINLKQCYECDDYPCKRLKQLDKRYKSKYNMSMIENLNNIKNIGIKEFLKNEDKRWKCRKCGGLICVHRNKCLKCDI
ncbi:MAG: DUF3795 domain-containing protein [Clostridia bacterium]|nr:DUF3795 domain-containing protein [Clostridia bacterium]MDD4387014.1 DUF3795 domain-containing protein [Clostridia bacterium]